MSIARNIRAVRTRNNLTQEEFGEIVGVSSMAVSQWETGRAVPRMGAVQKISDYFHISKGSLIDEDSSTLTKLPISGSTATLPLRTLGKVHAGVMDDDDACDDEEIQVPEPSVRCIFCLLNSGIFSSVIAFLLHVFNANKKYPTQNG